MTVGVDYGDLVGTRARGPAVADGAELGTGPVHEYAHAVIERGAAGLGRACRPLGAAGPRRLPRPSLRDRRAGGASRTAGIDPDRGRRHRHRLHRVTPLPVARRRHAAGSTSSPRAPARLRRSSGSTTPPSARPTASTQLAAERGEPWLARYGGRISSEWEFAKALQVLEEDPRPTSRTDRCDRGRRLDRLAAVRARDAQRLHGRLQGHPPGRRVPRARVPRARSTRASPASSPTSSTQPLGRSATARGGP